MRGRTLWLLVAGSGASLAAHAGLVATQSHTTDSGHGEKSHSVMRMSIQGDRARTDIVEFSQPNPMIGPGSYMLMTAGKSEVIIVNPAQKTFMRMDSRDMSGFGQLAGRAEKSQQQQGGGAFMENLKVEKTKDEAGPTLLGQPTRHIVYSISYVQPIGLQNQPIKMQSNVKETRELWVTHGLDAAAAQMADFKGLAAGAGQMTSSMAQLQDVDKQIAAEGFALKSIITNESKIDMPGLGMAAMLNPSLLLMKGKGGSSRSEMEVTELREMEVPADQFVLPKDYSEREIMNPNAGSMPDLNQMQGHPPAGQGTSQMPDLNNKPH